MGKPMTDAELTRIIRAAGRQRAREAVASLLAGNDAGCFSTEQYIDRHARLHWGRDWEAGAGFLRGDFRDGESLAHHHLRVWMAKLVREVRPDVWAAVDTLTQGARP